MQISHTEAQELHELVGYLRGRVLDENANDGEHGTDADADRALELAAVIVSDTDPANADTSGHHEDCDYRVSRDCGDEHECNLDCEATAVQLPHLNAFDVKLIVVALGDMREEQNREAARYDTLPGRELSARSARVEAVHAENLRRRLRDVV